MLVPCLSYTICTFVIFGKCLLAVDRYHKFSLTFRLNLLCYPFVFFFWLQLAISMYDYLWSGNYFNLELQIIFWAHHVLSAVFICSHLNVFFAYTHIHTYIFICDLTGVTVVNSINHWSNWEHGSPYYAAINCCHMDVWYPAVWDLQWCTTSSCSKLS